MTDHDLDIVWKYTRCMLSVWVVFCILAIFWSVLNTAIEKEMHFQDKIVNKTLGK